MRKVYTRNGACTPTASCVINVGDLEESGCVLYIESFVDVLIHIYYNKRLDRRRQCFKVVLAVGQLRTGINLYKLHFIGINKIKIEN